MKYRIFVFLLLPIFFSCSKRNLTYFSNYGEEEVLTETIVANTMEPIIQAGDLLQITVSGSNAAAAAPFNRISHKSGEGNVSDGSSGNSSDGYLVDANGIIDFPVLGRIKVSGVSKNEAKLNLTNLLTNYLGNPIVNIRYLNYRVTVIGEVRNPNTFLVPSERMNIMEAIGKAGDLTAYGKRENVKVIHESNGIRTIANLNLNDKKVFDSPYFHLKPNDIVYVEAVKSRREQASLTRANISIALGIITAASLVILNLNR